MKRWLTRFLRFARSVFPPRPRAATDTLFRPSAEEARPLALELPPRPVPPAAAPTTDLEAFYHAEESRRWRELPTRAFPPRLASAARTTGATLRIRITADRAPADPTPPFSPPAHTHNPPQPTRP